MSLFVNDFHILTKIHLTNSPSFIEHLYCFIQEKDWLKTVTSPCVVLFLGGFAYMY